MPSSCAIMASLAILVIANLAIGDALRCRNEYGPVFSAEKECPAHTNVCYSARCDTKEPGPDASFYLKGCASAADNCAGAEQLCKKFEDGKLSECKTCAKDMCNDVYGQATTTTEGSATTFPNIPGPPPTPGAARLLVPYPALIYYACVGVWFIVTMVFG